MSRIVRGHRHTAVSNVRRGETLSAWLMLLPFLIFFALFVIYPLVQNFIYSLTNYNFGPKHDFVGLKNYIQLFSDEWFLASLKNTVVYAFFSVIFLTGLGLVISVMLNKRSRMVKAARTVLILPYATSMVAVSMVWLFLLDPTTGYINKLLIELGVSTLPTWLNDPELALPSLIFINIWKNLGYCMIIYLSGLQNIPTELYEAAEVDGASTLRRHISITLPQIAPVTFFVLITNCIEAFKTFEQVQIMTQGGPMTSTTTVVLQIYRRAFEDFRMGYASAIAVVLFGIIFIMTVINLLLFKRRSEDK
ncbi:MAG: sugar ABC transporter permease [Clostridia bacterium]|nr:sugar ABC transporter permease [Clostridia bacterium]